MRIVDAFVTAGCATLPRLMGKGMRGWCFFAAAVVLAGCGGGSAGAPAVTPTASPSAPSCSTATAAVSGLQQPRSTVAVDEGPFAAVPIPGTDRVVVSTSASAGGRLGGGELDVLQMASTPSVVGRAAVSRGGGALGMGLSHDGRWLAVTSTSLTEIVSVSGLLTGDPNPVVATLNDPGLGTIEAAFSMDDHFVFVADENSAQLSVFDVAAVLSDGFASQPTAVGQVPLGPGPVGIVVSPDGHWVYATTEGDRTTPGALWVIDEQAATRHPTTAAVAHVALGCVPVRVALSPTGDLAWVTVRLSNQLVGVDTTALRLHRPTPIRASVRVGSEPTGLALFGGGHYAVLTNSARFVAPSRPQTLCIVDLDAALAGRPAIQSWIAAGAFPREVTIDGAVGVATNFNSNTVETFALPA